MAQFYRYPADWDFDKIQRYSKGHKGGDVDFALGAQFYRVPGDWDFQETAQYVAKHPARSPLQFSTVKGLGQYGPYMPAPANASISQTFIVTGEDGKPAPSGETYPYVITNIKTAAGDAVPGLTQKQGKATSGDNGMVTISLDNLPIIFSSQKMTGDVALYRVYPDLNETHPIFNGKGLTMPSGSLRIDLTAKSMPGAKTPGGAAAQSKSEETDWVKIGGIVFVLLGVGFIGYQIAKRNKKPASLRKTLAPQEAVADWD